MSSDGDCWLVDDAGTLWNICTRKTYDYPDELLPLLNLNEIVMREQKNIITDLNKLLDKDKIIINDLKCKVNDLERKDCECDFKYWKGVERAYENICTTLSARNHKLERDNQVLIEKNYEDKEKVLRSFIKYLVDAHMGKSDAYKVWLYDKLEDFLEEVL